MFIIKVLFDGRVYRTRHYSSAKSYKQRAYFTHKVYGSLHYQLIDGAYQLIFASLLTDLDQQEATLACTAPSAIELKTFLSKKDD